jgi:cellulose biosynthesis protein BcsS
MRYSDSSIARRGIRRSIRGGTRAGIGALGAAAAGLALCTATAEAEEPAAAAPPAFETWSGAQVFPHIWSVYGGITWAPFGSVREDGLRVRGVSGYGSYGAGSAAFGDILLGYHKQLGTVTIKVFGGFTTVSYAPDLGQEPWPALYGTEYGAKGVLEGWWTISDQAWASLDLSFGSTHMDYGSRVRLGWRLWPELSAGLEGGAGGTAQPDLEHDTSRLGAFLRYEWASGEVSVSGGWAADGTWSEREWPAGAFGTVAVLTRF